MEKNKNAAFLLKELEAEYAATKKCIERIPASLFSFKLHSTSMSMGNLTSLVSEIPKWISAIATQEEIDLATYAHDNNNTEGEVTDHFEANYKDAQKALKHITNENLQESFSLKAHGETMLKATRLEHIASGLNHWVHHRGQLTVYMRMNEIQVPSLYGPSADENPLTLQ